MPEFFLGIFVLSASAIIYSYLAYPLLISSLSFIFRRPDFKKDDSLVLPITMIISAYNEASVIREKMHNVLSMDYPRDLLEVIVASESTDDTNQIVESYQDKGITLKNFTDRKGKAATLYRVVPEARGQIIIFSDANSFYKKDALKKIVRNFFDSRVGAVIGQLQYRSDSGSMGGVGEKLYWAYELLLRRFANRVKGFVPGINGAIFAIRNELYFPITPDRGDDYELSTRVAIHGYEVVSEPDAIAQEDAMETSKQQFQRKKRLVRWNFISSMMLIKEALSNQKYAVVFQIFSQKLMRYFVPLFLITLFISSLILSFYFFSYQLFLSFQLAFYITALLSLLLEKKGYQLPKICMIPSYFVMVNSAAAMGVYLGCFYGQSAIWQKQR